MTARLELQQRAIAARAIGDWAAERAALDELALQERGWAGRTAERIRREGEQITAEQIADVCKAFRRVGDSYALIADAIEHDHREKETP